MIMTAEKKARAAYWPFIRSSLTVLLPLWILSELMDQYFALGARLATRGSPEQMMAQVGQLATAVTVSFVLILLLPIRIQDWQQRRKPYRSWMTVAHEHGGPLFIEGLRMTGVVILWALLLILPGIYKQIRLLFVPFVVLLDARYQAGEVDALERSADLTKGIMGWLVLLFLGSMAAEIGFEMLPQFLPVLTHPAARVLTGGLSMLISIYFYIWFFFIYEARALEVPAR